MKTTILSLLLFLSLSAAPQSAREISLKAMNAVETGDMEMTSTIIIADSRGNERVRQISIATRQFDDCTKMLTVFVQPADVKGTSLLVYDYENKEDNMWIYMPALRKVRRILSTDKAKNFMGSEFSNADMSKPNIDDFSYTFLGFETLDGIRYRRIESTPKNDNIAKENNFSRKISFFDATTNLCYRIEYYDLAGKLHRIQTISNYKKLPSGKYFAHHMLMENVQNGRKTTMKVDRFQQGSNLPESRFSPNTLDQ